MAAFTRLLAFAIVTMATVQIIFCQNYDEWIKTAHEIGDEITLNCSEYPAHPRQEIPEEFTVIRSWMGPAPNLYVWNVWRNLSEFVNISQSECPSCEILEDGFQFRINHFDPTIHIGVYHCMLYNETTDRYYLVKWGVNMRGPYFEDLLEKYEQNIIIGISAFGGFTVVAITILLVYKFRWTPDGPDGQHSTLATSQNNYGTNNKIGMDAAVYNNVTDGKVNPAFSPDTDAIYRNAESPPEYNGVKAEVQVHAHKAQPSTSSSSSSEGGSVRRRDTERDVPYPPTPHHTVNQGFDFGEDKTTYL